VPRRVEDLTGHRTLVRAGLILVVDRHMARAVTGIKLNWPEPGR
jgi:hypothetical protein